MKTDWCQLPHDILSEVLSRLSLSDFIRFGAVCKSWLFVQREKSHYATSELPWLVLCDDDHNNQTRGFFSLTDGKTHRLHLPEVMGMRCCGSCHGWLITMDLYLNLYLLHPFTRMQISLPRLPPFYVPGPADDPRLPPFVYCPIDPSDLESYRHVFIDKAILSCDPYLNPSDCVVIIHYGELGHLAFCRLGGKEWNTTMPRRYGRFDDIISYKSKFLATTSIGVILLCDLSAMATAVEFAPPIRRSYPTFHYLVESQGDLLQVVCSGDYYHVDGNIVIHKSDLREDEDGNFVDYNLENDEDHHYRTNKFEVFKLDATAGEWVEVESLGDRAVFLGGSYTISLSASDFPGCKPNSIYFTDAHFDFRDLTRYGYEDLGVYHLEDGKVEQYYPSEAYHPQMSPPFWFEPTPHLAYNQNSRGLEDKTLFSFV